MLPMLVLILTLACNLNAIPIKSEVKLNEFHQNESDTRCLQNLLLNDMVFVTGSVKANEEINKATFLLGLISKTNLTFSEYQVTSVEHCNETDSEFTRAFNKATNSFRVTFKKPAIELLSEGESQLKFIHGNLEELSNKIKLPAIFDPQNVVIRLDDTVLAKKVINSLNLSNHYIKICCENAPSPYHIVITHDSVTIEEKSSCIIYKVPKSGLYFIGYRVCENENFMRHYKINITLENEEDLVNWTILTGALSTIAVLGIIGIMLFILWRYNCISLTCLQNLKRRVCECCKKKNSRGPPNNISETQQLSGIRQESCRLVDNSGFNSSRKHTKEKPTDPSENEQVPGAGLESKKSSANQTDGTKKKKTRNITLESETLTG
ncbi:hypothetical protein Btru_041079 [Bulinus truncatus]|nr:hypothetical protein Btru_041079 [Bulinus truncatus]